LNTGFTHIPIRISVVWIMILIQQLPAEFSMMHKLPQIRVDAKKTLKRLILEEDVDHDLKITIDDHFDGGKRGDKVFVIETVDHQQYEIRDTYYLANLLQELKLALDRGETTCDLNFQKIFEDPVQRISRQIRSLYWDGLTRQITLNQLKDVIADEKTTADSLYLYIPDSDRHARNYYQGHQDRLNMQGIEIRILPIKTTPLYIKSIRKKHGLLMLDSVREPSGELKGKPYVVPGGRFNEMYGWDSYFIVLGLLEDERTDLARSMVDHHVYQIRHYGKILNANRTYYLTRSQPPLLSSMAIAVYRHLPENSENDTWMREVCRTIIREYRQVWTHPDRMTDTGLSRYFGEGAGPPVEVESGHFNAIYRPYAATAGIPVEQYEKLYIHGDIKEPLLDLFFKHDRAVRESGHDTTFRWQVNGKDRCADFVTVDLNALLYKMECDVAYMIDTLFNGRLEMSDGSEETSGAWLQKAADRKDRIRKYLWNASEFMFYDYNFVDRCAHPYTSATAFYPLWAHEMNHPEHRLLTSEEADRLIDRLLRDLECPGGLAASAKVSRGPVSDSRPQRQWDYPYGWAPHQMIAWQGMMNYGHHTESQRCIYRWLYTITRNAVDYNGTIPEKYDVTARSHQVFAEYGNVGTRFAYITREGFGWMNASYQVGRNLLTDDHRECLNQLIPPEWIFPE